MTTHAHYAGEFGAQRMTKALSKDPAFRAARAEHYANEAQSSSLQHAMATHLGHKADAAQHALVVAHAEQRAGVHARAATKLAPGSIHAVNAEAAHEATVSAHDDVKLRESTANMKPTQKIPTETIAHVAAVATALQKSVIPKPPQKSVGPTRASTAKTIPIPMRSDEAKEATSKAFAATKKASDNPTIKTQTAAAEAHAMAAKLNTVDPKTVALHERMTNHHRNRAETIPLDGTKAVQIPVIPVIHDDKHLTQVIHDTAAKIGLEGRFGDRKVFSHEIYKMMSAEDKTKFGGNLDNFKDKVRDLAKKGSLTTARADLVATMNPDQVSKSHINLEDVGHHGDTPGVPHVNFVETTPIKDKK